MLLVIWERDSYNDAALCRDDKFRTFSHYGSSSHSFKFYKRLAPAIKRASRVKGGIVVQLPEGWEIDACLRVMNPETRETRHAREFKVWGKPRS